MRVRPLVHLLPWLLLLALGSCVEGRLVAHPQPVNEHPGPPGLEVERGGPGWIGEDGLG